jgi:hypothetical protein
MFFDELCCFYAAAMLLVLLCIFLLGIKPWFVG